MQHGLQTKHTQQSPRKARNQNGNRPGRQATRLKPNGKPQLRQTSSNMDKAQKHKWCVLSAHVTKPSAHHSRQLQSSQALTTLGTRHPQLGSWATKEAAAWKQGT
jgi:hypothetical protein